MLLHEEEMRELGIAQRHRDEPGRRDDEKKRRSARQLEPAQQCPVAPDHHVKRHGRGRQHDADQPLAQHGEGAGGPPASIQRRGARSGVLAYGALGVRAYGAFSTRRLGHGKGKHRCRKEYAHAHVERVELAEGKVERSAARIAAAAAAPGAPKAVCRRRRRARLRRARAGRSRGAPPSGARREAFDDSAYPASIAAAASRST